MTARTADHHFDTPVRLRQTPSGIEQRLLGRARRRGLQPGDTLIVGFSGGRDSLVLAAALRRVEKVLQVRSVLVHVDHRLRPESDEDALRASRLAEQLGAEALIRRLPAHPVDAHQGVGIEEAARRERYRVLCEEAAARNAIAVVTAHHQSDQAETVLLHLLRGSGVHGAAGMSEWSAFPKQDGACSRDISPKSADSGVALWRPFLTESRTAIDEELEALGIDPIDDPSNDDRTLRRNALRHDVMPLLEIHFPGATASLARYAALAAEDDQALQVVVASLFADAVDPDGQFRAGALRDQPLAVQRRLVRNWLLRSTGIEMLSLERTEAVLTLASSGETNRFVEVGAGWRARRVPGALVIENVHSDHDDREMGER